MDSCDLASLGEDGVTHINIYTKGHTALGRALTNPANIPFNHPKYGKFATIESYWHWTKTGRMHDGLRSLSGLDSKKEAKKYEHKEIRGFRELIEEAIEIKVKDSPTLLTKLKESTLPFRHYYTYGILPDMRVVEPEEFKWIPIFVEELRDRLNGKSLRAIIAGSRPVDGDSIVSLDKMTDLIEDLKLDLKTVVCGDAMGVDNMGAKYAEVKGLKVKHMPAKWKETPNGPVDRAAGYKRNAEMARYGDILIAFWDGESRGTAHMVSIMRDLGKPIYMFTMRHGEVTEFKTYNVFNK